MHSSKLSKTGRKINKRGGDSLKQETISIIKERIWSSQTVKFADVWKKKGFLTTEETQKLLLASIKSFDEDSLNNLSLKNRSSYVFTITGLIEQLTPKQFYQIIPIKKDFNGHKWGFKDYFYTKEWIEKNIGWNSKIPNGFQFLMEYWSDEVFELSIWMMTVISDFQQRQSGKPLFEKFAEENGIKLHTLGEFGLE